MTLPSIDPKLAWRDDYSVGVAELDEQHKKLLGLLTKLNLAGAGNATEIGRSSQLMHLLDELNEYATYHFLHEERMMRDHVPADESSARHVIAHRSYWRIVGEFKERHRRHDPNVGHELLDYLNRWWVNHIQQTDKALGAQLNLRGIR